MEKIFEAIVIAFTLGEELAWVDIGRHVQTIVGGVDNTAGCGRTMLQRIQNNVQFGTRSAAVIGVGLKKRTKRHHSVVMVAAAVVVAVVVVVWLLFINLE